MTRSPLILSCTLVASLSLLNIGSAWSAPASQEKAKTSTGVKAKTFKAKTKKAKTLKAKNRKAVSAIKTDAAIDKSVPAAVGVTTNPYLANQPVAIQPKAANPYLAAPASAVPIVSAPSVPALAAPSAPALATPQAAASEPSPAVAAAATPATVAVQAPAAAPVAAYQPWSFGTSAKNPYMVYQQPYIPPDPTKLLSQFGDGLKMAIPFFPQASNSTPSAPGTPNQATPAKTSNPFSQIFTSLKTLLPSGALTGDTTYLPVIKRVYPTGEKPLVVLNFKCPTEMIGVTPPPMKLLHEAINLGFDGLNKTNLLSFNLQQVCS